MFQDLIDEIIYFLEEHKLYVILGVVWVTTISVGSYFLMWNSENDPVLANNTNSWAVKTVNQTPQNNSNNQNTNNNEEENLIANKWETEIDDKNNLVSIVENKSIKSQIEENKNEILDNLIET